MKVVLSIAGSDSSGGAGIQADLKTFEYFGVFGCSVLTVLTAQNTQGVSDIAELSPSFVQKQLEAVSQDFELAAIKIGMLFSNDIINIVKEFIKPLNIPIVFDPVFISKAGSPLLSPDAIANLRTLMPYVTLTTPNLYEAQNLFGKNYTQKEIQSYGCHVLVKNNNIEDKSVDILYTNGEEKRFYSDFIPSNNTHGTGCSFSSAIAANLALGHELTKAIEISKAFISDAILNAPHLGHGKGPILHNLRLKNG